ncbi:uncharacterized protein [Haliotis cracherodii]|uniref:uncharacterized protein n=1 Tax=Haliotis cracherodii TaxID=6455 RepID=UPI0039EBEF98
MATSLRRNTFTLKGSDLPPSLQPTSGMDRQNIMRLKVNRIAIVQELKVEHILDQLCDARILNLKDRKKIEKGTTPSDRARILIDILPTKPKDSDWYKCFRESLQNPDANVEFRKRYRDLVEFLDNTVIHRPASQASRFSDIDKKVVSLQYPKYEPLPAITEKLGTQNILYLEGTNTSSVLTESGKGTQDSNLSKPEAEAEDKTSVWSEDSPESMTLIKGFFHQWVPIPENFHSLIEIPREQVKELTESSEPEDQELLETEKRACQKMRKLEVVAALNRRKQLPLGFEIGMCDAFQELLAEPELYPFYLKYFRHINMSGVNIIRDIANSYHSVLEALEVAKSTEATKQVISTGFKIVDLFIDFNCLAEAEEVMSGLIRFLNTNPCIETWMAKYKGYVKLMHLRNKNYDFNGSQQAYFWSTEVTWAIKMMSFGQDFIDESETFVGLSFMLLETGSLTPASGWANKALKEVEPDNTSQVIECLCNAVMVCCASWQVNKAEMLAVQAVQMARSVFGKYHLLYLKALLHYCHLSSEFLHGEEGLQAAKECLTIAMRIYSCETIQIALAHRAVSRALMATQRFDTDDFYFHSMEAIRIARSQLPQGHPMLQMFLITFASALQWKSLNCSKDEQDSTLRWAEAEAKQALVIVSTNYGEISLRSAQVYSLLGQIYSKMNSHPDLDADLLDEAEKHLELSMSYMRLCQSPGSNYLLLAMATLATFYKIVNKPTQAVPLLQQVIAAVESPGFYLRWVHMCYDNLVKLLQSGGQNKQADDVQKSLSHWLQENPALDKPVSLDTLRQKPPLYKEFLEKYDKWGATVKKALLGFTAGDGN